MNVRLSNVAHRLYLFSFFDSFILIYPLYSLMFADYGIDARHIASLFIVWSLTGFILELPSGALADKYPRRNILLIGQVAKILGFLSWLIFRFYWGFLVGFILWGVKVAFTSGTKEALVYDELNRLGKVDTYAKIAGRMEAFLLSGVIAGGFGASLLAHRGYSLILTLSILSVVLSSISVMLLPKVKNAKLSSFKTSYLRDGIKVIKKPAVLALVLGISIIIGLGAMDEYFGLFFREKGLSNSAVAAWITITYIFSMIGSTQAHRLGYWRPKVEYFLPLWAGLVFAAAVAPRWLAPLLLSCYMLVFSGLLVLLNSSLQHALEDKTRATASSVSGFITEVLSVLVFGYFAVFSEKFGYVHTFRLFSGVIVASGLLFFVILKVHLRRTQLS